VPFHLRLPNSNPNQFKPPNILGEINPGIPAINLRKQSESTNARSQLAVWSWCEKGRFAVRLPSESQTTIKRATQ
jgi:hypothetical protein